MTPTARPKRFRRAAVGSPTAGSPCCCGAVHPCNCCNRPDLPAKQLKADVTNSFTPLSFPNMRWLLNPVLPLPAGTGGDVCAMWASDVYEVTAASCPEELDWTSNLRPDLWFPCFVRTCCSYCMTDDWWVGACSPCPGPFLSLADVSLIQACSGWYLTCRRYWYRFGPTCPNLPHVGNPFGPHDPCHCGGAGQMSSPGSITLPASSSPPPDFQFGSNSIAGSHTTYGAVTWPYALTAPNQCFPTLDLTGTIEPFPTGSLCFAGKPFSMPPIGSPGPAAIHIFE